ncbi:MAG: hypothetical protein PHP95_13335 [Desulfuromonadaceae bacterium]|nr:hypothetical protein [Desulfuromonadaceae bacterium]MDD2849429.1 hypothetical protein [Desulfuromonadaceae bacterium]MDD4130003.1 hypothetical protein [Desulfuromonadaceae bacterium]
MRHFTARMIFVIVCFLLSSTAAFTGTLDDYYLQQFGEAKSAQLQKAVLSVAAVAQEPSKCGMPLKKSLLRDWDLLETSTQKVLVKQLALPTLEGEATFDSGLGHFKVHYATSGTDAPPLTDITGVAGVPDWVETVAVTLENVYSSYGSLGYQPAPTLSGAPYNIYLRDLAPLNYYGVTTSGASASSATYPYAVTSWMELDNNYTDDIYHPTTYSPVQSLQITAAHEYHHAIQFGYNRYFDAWYAEATSTWLEDELYNNVNQLYTYLTASLLNTNLSLDISVSTTTGGGYGRWLINRYFSETHPDQNIVRLFWETLSTRASNNGNDIPMSPIIDEVLQLSGSNLGDNFLGYTQRLYTRQWTTHLSDIISIPNVYLSPTSSIYPINVASVPSPATTLPHHSYIFFRLLPPTAAPSTLNITLTRDVGISAVALRKTNNTISIFTPNSGANLIVIPSFDTASEVVLLIANATSDDNLLAGFSTDGSLIQYELPGTTITSATSSTTPPSISLQWLSVTGATSYQLYRSSTSSTSLILYKSNISMTSYTDTDVVKDKTYYYSVVPINDVGLIGPASEIKTVVVNTTTATSGGSSGGGCFIATAAYGSYLHPQVQLLRDFRDNYLLTNAPGQAFVTLYYRYSPPLADFIAKHPFLRGISRLALTPLVVAVGHPLLSAVLLLLFIGTMCVLLLRRIKTTRSDLHPNIC